ncbi:hypothetical protein PGB90_006617 [Kerria lacca]
MEVRISKKIISDCNRNRNDICNIVEWKTQQTENELKKKIQNLEFYLNELVSQKETLTSNVMVLNSIKNRIEQSVKSLQYPKEICLKCIDLRKIVHDLCNDTVQNELKKETELIKNIEIFYNELLANIQEQLRKNRSVVYALEGDIQRKRKALKIEKQNQNLKITDLELISTCNEFIINTIDLKNCQLVEWEENSQQILENAQTELKNSQKLKLDSEESLPTKTAKLIELHERCNEVFYKCDVHHKDIKNTLEIKLSNVNEQISQIKQSLKEIENSFADNELQMKLVQTRLNNRIRPSYPELLNDNVEMTLMEEQKQLSKIKDELNKNWHLVHSSLASLNKLKNSYETEIEDKIKIIKIDEVQCLPLRSSIHYHAY